jgi:5-(carboxyamino)imidazole ribonucleotide synthase
MSHAPFAPVPPGGVVGVLGGGQLGRMLALAAARLGLKTHIFAPEDPCPAGDVAYARTVAEYGDRAALADFAASIDAATFEFENVPVEAVLALDGFGVRVAPNARALSTAQDRLVEKDFINSIGAQTAPYAPVDDLSALEAALARIGRPAVLKTRRFGYDGKGQTWLKGDIADLSAAWEEAIRFAWAEVGARPSILEGAIDFIGEISVIGARGADGAVALYDCPQNEHREGILRRSVVPASVPATAQDRARDIATRMMHALDYVGVIGVEFFVRPDGSVLVNEFAPRVHNSGHWTIDACACSQFEQHIRAIAGWPLASPHRHSDAVMENLIGEAAIKWASLAKEPRICLHLYGKGEARLGRKMGHTTKLSLKKD